MSWHNGRLALFDLESTGIDPHRDRIVTAAVIEAGAGAKTLPHEWLANPGIPIPEGAAQIHGVTTQHAQTHGRLPVSVVKEIAEQLIDCTINGVPVVGHNVTYDLTMLTAELHRHGHTSLASLMATIRPVVDTLILDKWLDPWRPKQPTARRKDPAKCGSRTLVDCARLYRVDLSEVDAHGAAADAIAAGRIAWRMANDTPGLQIPLDELHDFQVQLKREQAESFGAYLVKQGKPDDVSREWPIQSPPPGWTPEQLPEPRQETAA
jgi:DNA polymerase-3 subunit epsilon